ncbi:MAG: rod shape-determining protein RodA [Cytophagales bacterium]|nr:rod shape-determining protein RodA [Cytophagales bacterium]
MQRNQSFIEKVDWLTILLYTALVFMGWLNIYAAVYDEKAVQSIFSLSINSGKQLMWIGIVTIPIIILLVIDFKFFHSIASYLIYGGVLLLLVFVLLFGREVAGSKSWLELGAIRLQPAEFAKFATSLALAYFLDQSGRKLDQMKTLAGIALIIGLPMGLIILQGDTGSALVYTSLAIMCFREGLSPALFVIGIGSATLFVLSLLFPPLYLLGAGAVVAVFLIVIGKKTVKRISLILAGLAIVGSVAFSVDYVVNNIFKPHQQNRVKAFINPEADPLGYGYNVTQSKIAIGSGGFWGKGFLQGTQTKFDFVPEQSTDFIFCTLGEEQGWVGAMVVIILFMVLLLRIIHIAERQKSRFARVYAYCVLSILLFHVFVNISMTIGMFPVIGIPLPFFSYGGSSLLSFTILLFILIKLDAHRMQVLQRM